MASPKICHFMERQFISIFREKYSLYIYIYCVGLNMYIWINKFSQIKKCKYEFNMKSDINLKYDWLSFLKWIYLNLKILK